MQISKSPYKIIANVLNIRIDCVKTEQGPGYGGALLAMTGCGRYKSISEACTDNFEISESILPDEKISQRYSVKYKNFTELYPSLKQVFKKLYF